MRNLSPAPFLSPSSVCTSLWCTAARDGQVQSALVICIYLCKIFLRLQVNPGSMFYVCKCQLLIGKFSSCCWVHLLTWKALYLPSPACRHLSEEAEVQANPASYYKKRLSRELALGEGKVVEYEFVRDSIIWSLSEPARFCLWTEDWREGRGWGFFMCWLLQTGPPCTYVLLHYSASKLRPNCSSWLWLLCTSPATHCKAGLDDSLLFTMQRWVCLNLPPSSRVGVWSALLGRHPRQLSTSYAESWEKHNHFLFGTWEQCNYTAKLMQPTSKEDQLTQKGITLVSSPGSGLLNRHLPGSPGHFWEMLLCLTWAALRGKPSAAAAAHSWISCLTEGWAPHLPWGTHPARRGCIHRHWVQKGQ